MKSNWIINLCDRTATHSNYGTVVRFAATTDGGWNVEDIEIGSIPPDDFDASLLAQVMSEASDEFLKALENEKL